MTLLVVLVVVVAFAGVLALFLRSQRTGDGVDSFRRQIDALSPEARRPTVDQVKSVERDTDDDDRSGHTDDGPSDET